MKKIMFNDRFGLTAAVLNGQKTMTRRIVPSQYVPMIKDGLQGAALIEAQQHGDAFREGEVVAVAQKYLDLRNCDAFYEALSKADPYFPLECIKGEKGAYNKMFVKAEWMPHRIRITDIKVERLRDISDEDCMREGLWRLAGTSLYHYDESITRKGRNLYHTPREAFSALIDKVSGKRTWERNPWVFAYSFELERRARP